MSPKNFKIQTPTTLEPYNFLCRPPIEVRFQEKLYPLLKSFQGYMACHLNACNLGQFLTFNGQESN